MEERSPMTRGGYRRLGEELAHLKTVERAKASRAIEEARAHGDLSENAEYDAAKEAQGLLEAKIKVLEGRLATALVVDIETLSGTKVIFGATVEVCEVDTDERRTVTIVGEDEADAARGLISYRSPFARALIGKVTDDIARVQLPSGERDYEILEVKFDGTVLLGKE